MDKPTDVHVLEDVNVKDLVEVKTQSAIGREDLEDSFFICDLGDLVRKQQKWTRLFPRVEPYYATKACPYNPLLSSLMEMGVGFDCASKEEIELVLKLGGNPEKIIYANPCKQRSHIRYAKEQGVCMMVFDNEMELVKIKQIFPDAELVLRIHTNNSAALYKLSNKFGASEEESFHLLKKAKTMGLNVLGVSFHVGSGCLDALAYVKSLEVTKKVFDYGKQVGFRLNLIDIGGGFPGTDDVSLKVEKIASVVNETFENLFPRRLYGDLRIIAEPGRYFCASAFTLATNVIAVRTTSGKGHHMQREYFVNEGMHGSFTMLKKINGLEMQHYVLKEINGETKYFKSRVWGQTCDGGDVLLNDCIIPELFVGDWLIWRNMGAYTLSMSTHFNGFKTTAFYNVISKDYLNVLRGNDKKIVDEHHVLSSKVED